MRLRKILLVVTTFDMDSLNGVRSLGRLAYAGRDLCTNEAIAALTIRQPDILMKEYLYWYLTFFDWGEAAKHDEKLKGKTLNARGIRYLQGSEGLAH